jgi:OOP family OmpA-OmpF porin
MDYYKQVKGKKLDGHLIEIADEAVKGAGDGRISEADAAKILAAVIKDNIYTAIEQATIDYLHKNYHWTESARDWFRDQIKNWEKEFGRLVVMTPEEISKQHFPAEDVLKSEEERISRKNDLDAATIETYQDHDDIGIIVRLATGKRAEVLSNYIEMAENFVELRGGFNIPLRAIEKVEI